MPDAPLAVRELTKRYGSTVAVDDLSFSVRPGRVTGLLGPNGAGKTTVLRCLLGLATPDAGLALVLGQPYRELEHPARNIGAVVGAGFHPGRSGRDHLRVLAFASGVAPGRVDDCLDITGIAHAAARRVDGLSTGMLTRLAMAGALLAEPEVLVLDEPAAGLDPKGVRWLRDVLRDHTAGGGTVLLSSHALAELSQFVDDVIIVDRGRFVAHDELAELTASAGGALRVRCEGAPDRLADALRVAGATVQESELRLVVDGLDAATVGRVAAANGIPLTELAPLYPALEKVFLRLTGDQGRAGDAGLGSSA